MFGNDDGTITPDPLNNKTLLGSPESEKKHEELVKVSNCDKRARSWENAFAGNLCIGENHDEIAAKKFLIQNMRLLKENGFDILILEHFTQDDHQQMIDNYLRSKEMHPDLLSHIKNLM